MRLGAMSGVDAKDTIRAIIGIRLAGLLSADSSKDYSTVQVPNCSVSRGVAVGISEVVREQGSKRLSGSLFFGRGGI
jgi:hypothetical protein